jgi:hypothetical protein
MATDHKTFQLQEVGQLVDAGLGNISGDVLILA